jgi:hypothetical protein
LRDRRSNPPPKLAEIEHLVMSRVRQWLLDPGGIYQSTRLPDLSAQRRLIACAVEIGKSWTGLPGTRQRAFFRALIDRIDVGAHQIDIHLRQTRLTALLDGAATPLPSATDDEIQILSIRCGYAAPGGAPKGLRYMRIGMFLDRNPGALGRHPILSRRDERGVSRALAARL